MDLRVASSKCQGSVELWDLKDASTGWQDELVCSRIPCVVHSMPVFQRSADMIVFVIHDIAYRTTKKFVTLPNNGVVVIASVSVYELFDAFPGVAVRYAWDAIKKFASSLASLYFSLVTRRSSVVTAP